MKIFKNLKNIFDNIFRSNKKYNSTVNYDKQRKRNKEKLYKKISIVLTIIFIIIILL